jgi:hypothetical protein
MADTNHPDSWIQAIKQARGIGPIDTVFPGHGKFDGMEICVETIRWLDDYRQVAKPGVRFTDLPKKERKKERKKEMMRRHPSHGFRCYSALPGGPGSARAEPKMSQRAPQVGPAGPWHFLAEVH